MFLHSYQELIAKYVIYILVLEEKKPGLFIYVSHFYVGFQSNMTYRLYYILSHRHSSKFPF